MYSKHINLSDVILTITFSLVSNHENYIHTFYVDNNVVMNKRNIRTQTKKSQFIDIITTIYRNILYIFEIFVCQIIWFGRTYTRRCNVGRDRPNSWSKITCLFLNTKQSNTQLVSYSIEVQVIHIQNGKNYKSCNIKIISENYRK